MFTAGCVTACMAIIVQRVCYVICDCAMGGSTKTINTLMTQLSAAFTEPVNTRGDARNRPDTTNNNNRELLAIFHDWHVSTWLALLFVTELLDTISN